MGAFVMPNAAIAPETPLTAFSVPLQQLEALSGHRTDILTFLCGYIFVRIGEVLLLYWDVCDHFGSASLNCDAILARNTYQNIICHLNCWQSQRKEGGGISFLYLADWAVELLMKTSMQGA